MTIRPGSMLINMYFQTLAWTDLDQICVLTDLISTCVLTDLVSKCVLTALSAQGMYNPIIESVQVFWWSRGLENICTLFFFIQIYICTLSQVGHWKFIQHIPLPLAAVYHFQQSHNGVHNLCMELMCRFKQTLFWQVYTGSFKNSSLIDRSQSQHWQRWKSFHNKSYFKWEVSLSTVNMQSIIIIFVIYNGPVDFFKLVTRHSLIFTVNLHSYSENNTHYNHNHEVAWSF